MAQRTQKQQTARETAYIHGNTVRRLQPASQPEHYVPLKTDEEIREERERKYYAKRNAARATALSPAAVVGYTIALLVCCLVCAAFLYLQSDITTRLSAVTSLETTISDLKSDNDSLAIRLETAMTLDEIKARAAEMGLVYPAADQIRYYSIISNDYMNQYADVASK